MKSADANLLIHNGQVVTPDGVLSDGAVLIKDSKISYVGLLSEVVVPDSTPRLDANAGFIMPGFIDLHVNGGGGKDITEATEDAIEQIGRGHAKGGTTGLLVAVTGPNSETAKRGLRNASAVSARGTGGAKILGVHMEGPFVNPKRQGPVFREYEYVTNPSVDRIAPFVDASEGVLRIVTMAPELDGATQVIEFLVSQGIVASVGHTEATYEQVIEAFRAGVSYCSHIFNAMTGLQAREPGTVGALLTSPETVSVELVSDGHHVHPATIEVILKSKGIEAIVLATDAVEVVGTNLDSFTLPIGAGMQVNVRNGRTWGPEGQLIGSVLQMNHAVRNIYRWFKLPLHNVVKMASLIPSRILGMQDSLGSLEVGKVADLAILDRDFEATATIVDGDVVFRRAN
jgi:N-acetylglucosamine-6-phosphate deacetylase